MLVGMYFSLPEIMLMLQRFMRRLKHNAWQRLMAQPTPQLEADIIGFIKTRARDLPPDEGLRFLFRLDNRLYELQGELATRYGNGEHTKHRHLRYHDFFIGRIQRGETVLDVGCGIGAVAYDVAARAGAIVTGIDFDAASIAKAREQYAHPNITYIVGDVLKAVPENRVDVVILSNVLEHLPDRANFLRRLQNTVKPQKMLIRVPLFERDWRVPLKQELGVEWRLDDTHETEYTIESFQTEIVAAELTIHHLEVHWGEIWSEIRDERNNS